VGGAAGPRGGGSFVGSLAHPRSLSKRAKIFAVPVRFFRFAWSAESVGRFDLWVTGIGR
jgi:hypothetical protein